MRLETIKNMRLITFKAVQFMPENQQDNYKSFIIWFCKKATLKKKISKSLY